MVVVGIRNRGNICYASSVLQCVSHILGVTPADIVDLDQIRRIPSDPIDYYLLLIGENQRLREVTIVTLKSGDTCSFITYSQYMVGDVEKMSEYVVVATSILLEIPGYRIVSMVLYTGGHFTASVEHDGVWYMCNDDQVHRLDGMPTTGFPYLVMYRIVQ